jgi:multiple sugar transport system permease protein
MLWSKRTGLFVLLPAVVWILTFTVFPLIQSLWISFQSMRLGRPSKFAGWNNFERVFTDDRVREVLYTTAFLSIGGLILTLTFGVAMAWLFSRDIPGIRFIRAALTMPLFTAPVAIAFASIALFNETNGPVNNLLAALGVDDPVLWLSDPRIARVTVLIVDSWQWTPFVFIIVLAAMQAVPEDLYEAARIDTNSEAKIFFKVTLPLIMPAIGTVAILRFVETLKILDVPLNLTAGGPGLATQTYSYYTYITGLRSFNLGYGAALSWVLVILCVIITTIFFAINKKRYEIS